MEKYYKLIKNRLNIIKTLFLMSIVVLSSCGGSENSEDFKIENRDSPTGLIVTTWDAGGTPSNLYFFENNKFIERYGQSSARIGTWTQECDDIDIKYNEKKYEKGESEYVSEEINDDYEYSWDALKDQLMQESSFCKLKNHELTNADFENLADLGIPEKYAEAESRNYEEGMSDDTTEDVQEETTSSFTAAEQKAIDIIRKIPEVIEAEKNLQKETSKETVLSYIVEAPKGEHTAYQVQVGHNGSERFETYFRFEVELDFEDIMIHVYDEARDEYFEINEWRKLK